MQLSQLILEMQRIQEQRESRKENPISLRNQRFQIKKFSFQKIYLGDCSIFRGSYVFWEDEMNLRKIANTNGRCSGKKRKINLLEKNRKKKYHSCSLEN
jgi:hypothetical protein